MRRIMPVILLTASLIVFGAGCTKSSPPAVAPTRAYPGTTPYVPPTAPPPTFKHPAGAG